MDLVIGFHWFWVDNYSWIQPENSMGYVRDPNKLKIEISLCQTKLLENFVSESYDVKMSFLTNH